MAMNGLRRWPSIGALTASPSCGSEVCERMRYSNSTGTIVKESARLASNDRHTDSDSGENRYFAVPCNRNTGTKTMQMHKVAKTVGMATSLAPLMMAWANGDRKSTRL